MLSGVEATSPFEYQGVCLAPGMTTTDVEIPTAAFGAGRSSGMPALILRLPLSLKSVVGEWRRSPCGDLGGGILAIAQRRNIPSRSRMENYFCHTLVPLDP